MQVRSRIFYWYAALVAIYAGVVLLPVPPKATLTKYHLSVSMMRELDVTFIVLAAAIWFAAFYGYHMLHRYSQAIKRNKDGRQITKLTRGLLILAVGSPLSSIIASFLTFISQHNPSFAPGATIISNYVSVIVPLLAFLYISVGARGLSDLSRSRPRLRSLNFAALGVIILGVVFCYLIAHAHTDIRTAYHLPYGLVMLTLAIPYMYIWFLGLFAIADLQAYSRKVAGIVYRRSWSLLATGLGSLISVSIIIQYLTTLSSWLQGLSLAWVLVLLYVLLLLYAAAFILVALGAKKLMRIEEV